MSDLTSIIAHPVSQELSEFVELFNSSISSDDQILGAALEHVKKRGGKRMRPLLTLLMAKVLQDKKLLRLSSEIPASTMHAACSLELLHTASLVHDDVVDESNERRGQKSINAQFNNKIAVLVGDYLLASSLREVAKTQNVEMVKVVAKLGQTLSEGEIFQLYNIGDMNFSEDNYYRIISQKTASLFETCCYLAALSVGAKENDVIKACHFGHNVGMIFQIRDDIFDYSDSTEIGKPTGNDMHEGKLTLPVLYVLNNGAPEDIISIARNVKGRAESQDNIQKLIDYTKENGGIEYAQQKMDEYYQKAKQFIDNEVVTEELSDALNAYLDFVIGRNK